MSFAERKTPTSLELRLPQAASPHWAPRAAFPSSKPVQVFRPDAPERSAAPRPDAESCAFDREGGSARPRSAFALPTRSPRKCPRASGRVIRTGRDSADEPPPPNLSAKSFSRKLRCRSHPRISNRCLFSLRQTPHFRSLACVLLSSKLSLKRVTPPLPRCSHRSCRMSWQAVTSSPAPRPARERPRPLFFRYSSGLRRFRKTVARERFAFSSSRPRVS